MMSDICRFAPCPALCFPTTCRCPVTGGEGLSVAPGRPLWYTCKRMNLTLGSWELRHAIDSHCKR
jgi:hypothetical protein